MFCKNCNTELNTNDKFCPNCGLAVDPVNQNQTAPIQLPSKFNTYIKEILPFAKGMLLNPLKTIKYGITSLSKESSFILAGVTLFIFCLLNTIMFKMLLNKALTSNNKGNMSTNDLFGLNEMLNQSRKAISDSFSSPKFFLYTLLAAMAFFAIMLLTMFIVSKMEHKQDFNVIYGINCVSLSAITLLTIMLCGFILCLISYQLGALTFGIGNIIFIITLFTGFKTLITDNDSCQLIYLYAVAIILGNLLYFKVIAAFIKTALQHLVGGIINF